MAQSSENIYANVENDYEAPIRRVVYNNFNLNNRVVQNSNAVIPSSYRDTNSYIEPLAVSSVCIANQQRNVNNQPNFLKLKRCRFLCDKQRKIFLWACGIFIHFLIIAGIITGVMMYTNNKIHNMEENIKSLMKSHYKLANSSEKHFKDFKKDQSNLQKFENEMINLEKSVAELRNDLFQRANETLNTFKVLQVLTNDNRTYSIAAQTRPCSNKEYTINELINCLKRYQSISEEYQNVTYRLRSGQYSYYRIAYGQLFSYDFQIKYNNDTRLLFSCHLLGPEILASFFEYEITLIKDSKKSNYYTIKGQCSEYNIDDTMTNNTLIVDSVVANNYTYSTTSSYRLLIKTRPKIL